MATQYHLADESSKYSLFEILGNHKHKIGTSYSPITRAMATDQQQQNSTMLFAAEVVIRAPSLFFDFFRASLRYGFRDLFVAIFFTGKDVEISNNTGPRSNV